MGGDAGTNAAKSENSDASDWESTGVGNYNADLGTYMSNVNAKLAAGNPYQTAAYKQSQNLETSGAANAEDTAAKTATRGAALRTGLNAAATPAQDSENRLAATRNIDSFNASRDTANDQAWEGEQQGLLQDQLGGANSQAGANATYANQRSAATNGLLTQQEEEDKMWAGLGTTAMQGAGAGLTAAFT